LTKSKSVFGVLPIVADVVDVPGDHSVKTGPGTEGVIEGKNRRSNRREKRRREGAAMGAVKGVKDKNAKESVTKAAESRSRLAAYLMEAGAGTRLFCQKGFESWNWSWSGRCIS